jgi:hypothetical protein
MRSWQGPRETRMHSHQSHRLRAARPRAHLPPTPAHAPAPLTAPNCARRSDGPSLADSVDSAWETIDPVSPAEALPDR